MATEAVGLIASVCNGAGFTGECVEVLLAELVDGGGNVLGTADSPKAVDSLLRRLRVPVNIRAARTGSCVSPDAYLHGYTVDCGVVLESEIEGD